MEKEKILGVEGRILVRKSGTEKLIRVMVEGKSLEIIDRIAGEIASKIN
jgi:phosphoglucosamine mutase